MALKNILLVVLIVGSFSAHAGLEPIEPPIVRYYAAANGLCIGLEGDAGNPKVILADNYCKDGPRTEVEIRRMDVDRVMALDATDCGNPGASPRLSETKVWITLRLSGGGQKTMYYEYLADTSFPRQLQIGSEIVLLPIEGK